MNVNSFYPFVDWKDKGRNGRVLSAVVSRIDWARENRLNNQEAIMRLFKGNLKLRLIF